MNSAPSTFCHLCFDAKLHSRVFSSRFDLAQVKSPFQGASRRLAERPFWGDFGTLRDCPLSASKWTSFLASLENELFPLGKQPLRFENI
jgi:hypothetical protein